MWYPICFHWGSINLGHFNQGIGKSIEGFPITWLFYYARVFPWVFPRIVFIYFYLLLFPIKLLYMVSYYFPILNSTYRATEVLLRYFILSRIYIRISVFLLVFSVLGVLIPQNWEYDQIGYHAVSRKYIYFARFEFAICPCR